MKGFIRRQEENMAIRFLEWRYEKENLPLPPQSEIEKHAEKIVGEAHRVAKERGKNVLSIIKELVNNYTKKSPD